MKNNNMIRCSNGGRFFTIMLALSLAVPFLTGCGSTKKVSRSGFYFDTIITITLYNTDNEGYIDRCFAMAGDFERKLSCTVSTSAVSQINSADGEFVTVDDDTLALIKAGISYGKLSGGAFDITVGKLSNLWNISEIARDMENENREADSSVIPDAKQILKALSHVDYNSVEVRGNEVRLTDSKAAIDLGGIAKGYIADKMREYLNSEGITAGIINLGGNVLTLGPKENQGRYTIGIQKPFAPTGTTLGSLSVEDASVVSSGIYERYYTVDGKIYHHILDTLNGYPIENNLYQVTIINRHSIDGDALSTTCLALGLEDGLALIESIPDTEAIFYTSDEEFYYSSGIGEDIIFKPEI